MKTKLLLLATCLIGLNTEAKNPKAGLIAPQTAVFYPETFDAKAHLPSLSLVKELPVTAAVPESWTLRPRFSNRDNKSCVSLPIEQGASLYGTGEVKGSLLRNGKTIKLWNTDNYEYKRDEGKRLYQSHPWVLGVRANGTAFGVLADNTWKQELQLTDSIRFISDGPAFRVIVIEGNSPQAVMKKLTDLIGRIEMPPLWSIGYQQSRYSYEPDNRVREVANEFRNRKIPCDVIWFDIDYMDKFKIFTFDKSKFPDPKATNNYLHSKGFKGIWMIDPGVKLEEGYNVYDSGTAGNHWVKDSLGRDYVGKVWPGDCKFPDFTRPETQLWWGGLYKDFMSHDIDGVWNDMNEPAVFDGPDATMPESNLHRGGGDLQPGSHLRYHNVYGMLMIKSSLAGIKKVNPAKRPFILSRSGYLGSHRYGATWTGDNVASEEHMKMSVPMVLNLGLSGQPFSGPDIGGFINNTTPELFSQWIALGAYYPFSRGHACKDTNDKEPWAFGTETENVSRRALNRRYRMLPYFYTLFHEAATTGMPVMRPVFFADPRDTSLRSEDQAFLLGDNLLVVPRWANGAKLPNGDWRSISIDADKNPVDNYQPDVKLRSGAIVPIGKVIQNTTEYKTDSLTLYISTDVNGKAAGTLYEDAGDGYGYQKGDYAISSFAATSSGNKLVVNVTQKAGKRVLKAKTYQVKWITADGTFSGKWVKNNTITLTKR